MLYILWALISLFAFFYFVYVAFLGVKLVRRHVGLFAAVVLTLGLLSFAGRSDRSNNSGVSQEKGWQFTPVDSLDKSYILDNQVILDKTPISQNELRVTYARDKHTHKNMPVAAYARRIGASIGTEWTPKFIMIEPTANDNEFHYDVNGLTEWKLLGCIIFSNAKTQSGIIKLK